MRARIGSFLKAWTFRAAASPGRDIPVNREKARMIRGVFVVMAVVVIGSVATTYWFGLRVLRIYDRAALHRKAVSETQSLLSTLKDAETGQRGFLLTGDKQYLGPYDVARVRLPDELTNLRRLAEVGVATGDVDTIERLAEARLEEAAKTIETRRHDGINAAMEIVRRGEGKKTMDELRDSVARLQNGQEMTMRAEMKSAANATQTRTMAFIAVGFLNLVFLTWAYRRISVAMRERQAALMEVQRQKDLLAVTLASIGDCVIVTDGAGRITFMNPVAENITGWTLAEAHMRPAKEVFKIINEYSREPVVSPVDKVIEHGVIVGLANHTILIRKNGREVPIDDSGAPIKDADGTIRGVVLIFRDFSEYKEAERKLQEAKEEAETANKAKDQFLAMLSHELRTPLTPVLATLNLWEASEELPRPIQADVQMMRRSVELEARIIDDLLDLTRIARGLLSFSEEDTDVHEAIQFLVGMCRSEFRGKDLTLAMHLEAERHHVRTDAGRLQQVFWNIIKNAAKFTESGGQIVISSSNDDRGNLEVSVTDTGIGMVPETLSRLFTPFEQGEQAVGRRYGGLGLGMAISSALVELMGGTISARSEGVGKGSTFTISLPALEESALDGKSTTETPERASGSLRILLVEDHADTARALVRLLERRGYNVRAAGTMAAALSAIGEERFDLLICDIGLPDGTGLDLIQQVRRTDKTPALALSGFGMDEDIARAKAAGFGVHLPKPVNFQQLEAAIWQLTSDQK
jgi:PAS domain S-box-containing protein